MKVAFGNDHIGLALRDTILNLLKDKNIEVIDYGTDTAERAYSPLIAEKVGEEVVNKNVDRGILICGSGVGMSIAANKIHGVRCVVCSEPYTAKMSRQHNHSNILAFGSRVIGPELAKMIVEVWLETEYEGGRHEVRYKMIEDLEKKQCK
jgi:ribose 5-phosphate isomerase B